MSSPTDQDVVQDLDRERGPRDDAPPDVAGTAPMLVLAPPTNPHTGEPLRPGTVWVASVCEALAVASLGTALGLTYWSAVYDFGHASWLMAAVADPDTLGRVLLAVAVTAAALIPAIALVIAGYYAWAGYRWSRVAALIAWATTGLALCLNIVALPAIALATVAAVMVWLPPSQRFFTAWQARRHPETRFSPPLDAVSYGPLPRYRATDATMPGLGSQDVAG